MNALTDTPEEAAVLDELLADKPGKFVVIQPMATIYATEAEAKEQAIRMAQVQGGVWGVGRFVGRAIAQPPQPVAPKWEEAE